MLTMMLGLRKGEVLGLKWENVNLKDGSIFIVETRTRFTKEVTKSTKNERNIVWLGHKQLSSTADIYSHVDMEMKRESAKKLNALFKKTV